LTWTILRCQRCHVSQVMMGNLYILFLHKFGILRELQIYSYTHIWFRTKLPWLFIYLWWNTCCLWYIAMKKFTSFIGRQTHQLSANKPNSRIGKDWRSVYNTNSRFTIPVVDLQHQQLVYNTGSWHTTPTNGLKYWQSVYNTNKWFKILTVGLKYWQSVYNTKGNHCCTKECQTHIKLPDTVSGSQHRQLW
jgi:hypothetical protein